MSMLHEHVRLLGQFLRTDFKKIALLCALAMLAAIVLGFALGLLSPETVDMALTQFMAMIEDAGVVDSAGNLSPFGLLTNNWTAMLTAALYGFVPFLFLPLLSIAVNGLLMGLLAAWYHSNGISLGLYLAGILPQIHNTDLIGNMLDNRQIVCDENIGELQFLLQVLKEIEDLCLNGHIQR